MSKSLWAATRRTLVTLLTFFLAMQSAMPASRLPDKTAPFRLGGLVLGERLAHFKERFPGSACGTIKRLPVNRHTLDDPDGSEDLTCCVDDPNSLTRFSEFKVVSVEDQCPVLIGFWKEKIYGVGFTVEVSSIERLLPSFEKVYGQAHHTMHGKPTLRDDRDLSEQEQHAPLSWASWLQTIDGGYANLELSIAVLNAANGYAQERRLVQIDMSAEIDPGFSRW